MAGLNIGVVSFGIEANTDGLKKAFGDLAKLRKRVTRLAEAQTKGAQKTRAALLKQEIATRRAGRTFVELRQKMVKSGAPEKQVRKLEMAFQRLSLEMTSGKITVEQYARSMETFKDKVAKVNREFTKFKSGATDGKLGKLANTLRNLESSAVLAIGPLSGVGARIRSIGAIAGRSSPLIIGLFVGVTALGVAFAKLAANALNAGRVMEATFARFKAASGDIKIARKEMGFVIQTALKLGLRIDTSAKAFSRLAAAAAGTTLEGEGARKVFLAVSQAAAALRLSGGEVEGTFRAIEQMMSKGTVQAEELRGQLGERLPGAFRIAAEAMGLTTMELGKQLKLGRIMAEEFLPNLARALTETYGKVALENVSSFTGSMNNLTNQTFLFGLEFNRITRISKIVVGTLQKVASTVEFLRKNLVNIISLLGAVGAGLAAMASNKIGRGILFVAKAVRTLALAVVGFNFAVAFGAAASLAAGLAAFAIPIAVAVAAFIGLKFILDSTVESFDEMDTSLDDLNAGKESAKDLGTKFKTLSDGIDAAVAELKVLDEVMGFMDRYAIEDIERLTKRFETIAEVEDLSAEALKGLYDWLVKIGEDPASEALHDIEDAYSSLFDRLIRTRDAQADFIGQGASLKAHGRTIEDLNQRFIAIQSGSLKVVETFDEITMAGIEERRALEDLNVEISEQDRRVIELVMALLRNRTAMDALTESEKRNLMAKKAAESAQKKLVTGLVAATNKIEILQARTAALAEGPDSFEIFTKVTEKVLKMRDALLKSGATMQQAVAWSNAYGRALRTNLDLTDRFARANQQMAAVVTGALEDIIMKGGSVKDMLHDLAKALFNVMLRALFLDKLQASLFNLFQGGAAPSALGGTLGQGGQGAYTGPPRFAHGGSFKVPGSGGSDHVPISFMAKPGEVVSVQRPDQLAGKGGGSGVTIVQNNHFEGGGLADPNVLIPLLMENNKQLKGELMKELSRGAFR